MDAIEFRPIATSTPKKKSQARCREREMMTCIKIHTLEKYEEKAESLVEFKSFKAKQVFNNTV